MKILFTFLLLGIDLLTVNRLIADKQNPVQGAVLKKGTSIRIGNAFITNKRTSFTVKSNGFGIFSITATAGDTLHISSIGYLQQDIVVKDLKEVIVYLQTSDYLTEVVIKGTSVKQDLKEVEDAFRRKGIFYKGRPPLSLLSPLGGSPLTFFHELLSKDGRDSRRFHRYAINTANDYEISRRFNDATIKSVIQIESDLLPEFKNQYKPALNQIRTWNDFELYLYIKKSFQEFGNLRAK